MRFGDYFSQTKPFIAEKNSLFQNAPDIGGNIERDVLIPVSETYRQKVESPILQSSVTGWGKI